MVHGAVRSFFQLLGALVVGLLIALPLIVWRLSSGPIALDFLTPYIEEALTAPDGSLSVRLDGTVLAMGQRRTLEIRALGVRAYTGGEQPIATVPEVALNLNGRALLGGVIAPNSITLYRPHLRVVRDASGKFLWGIGDDTDQGGSDDVVRRVIGALVGEPDPSQPGRVLKRAAVIDADLVIDDLKLGTTWHAPDADIELRRVRDGLDARAHMVLDLAGEQAGLVATIGFDKASEQLDGELWLSGIRPAALAGFGGALAQLAALDLPLAGVVRGRASLDGAVERVAFDLAGGDGILNLPAPIDMRRPVASVALRGEAFDGLKQARLDEFSIDFGGPRLVLAAVADGLGGNTSLKLDAAMFDTPFDDLPRLWPAVVAPNAREWVVKNMSKGIAREARATISARSASGRFDDVVVAEVAGELRGDGVQVDYLHPMPVVRNGAAVATFDDKDFRINVKAGEIYGLKVKEGVVVLSGLADVDQFADIDLTIFGPAQDALKLIDNKPLRYATALGIDPASVGGDGVTRLKLKFPLLKDLRLDDVSVKVHSSVKNVFLPKVVMGLDLTRGDLEIDVDAKGLDATGPIVLGTIPGDLKWRENFSTKGVAFRSRYEVKAPRIDEDQRKMLGLDNVPFVAPFMTGPVAADVVATLQGGGKGDIEAKVDLSPARMSLPGMGWRKEERTTGGAEVLVRLEKNKIAATRFVVTAGDLQTRGQVAFDDGKPKRVDFSRLVYGGRTDVEGAINFRPGGLLDITARGDSFNAEPFVATGEKTPDEVDAAARARDLRKKNDDLPPMNINAAVKTMWVSKAGKLANATIAMQRDGKNWHHLALKANVGDGKSLNAQIQPIAGNKRSVKVTSDDAGAVLRAFDSYEHMMNGVLDVDAVYDDNKDEQPLAGTARISDYNIVNAPALARLLTVAALSGILDVLQGQGISFTTLDAPFVLSEGLLQLKDARAYGPALGLTGKGEIDLDAGRLALEGTVVPAYALNSVLGNIPLLGWLITGGEKGGGLVAFNYTMKGPTQEPDVTVNPLSALTPGFLRNLFNIFDDGSETEARKRRPAAPPQAPSAPPAQ